MLAYMGEPDSQHKKTMLNILKARGIKEDTARKIYALHLDYQAGKYLQLINKEWIHNS